MFDYKYQCSIRQALTNKISFFKANKVAKILFYFV